MVDIVQVAHAAGLPRRLASVRYRICTTSHLYAQYRIRYSSDCERDEYLTAATTGKVPVSARSVEE